MCTVGALVCPSPGLLPCVGPGWAAFTEAPNRLSGLPLMGRSHCPAGHVPSEDVPWHRRLRTAAIEPSLHSNSALTGFGLKGNAPHEAAARDRFGYGMRRPLSADPPEVHEKVPHSELSRSVEFMLAHPKAMTHSMKDRKDYAKPLHLPS